MTNTDPDRLLHLLEVERKVLKTGQFSDLAPLAHQMTQLVDRAIGKADINALTRIKAAAERNRNLLAAAQAGVASAHSRFQAIKDAGRNVQTYDQCGNRAALKPSGPWHELRR